MANLNKLSAQELGRRLRLARKRADIRQQQAAEFIGVSRPTLVSIEKGQRGVRLQELQRLAQFYGESVNNLLRREAVHTDLVPRFRKMKGTEDRYAAEAIELLNHLVIAEVELENVLGIVHRKNYPPERGIASGNEVDLAEQHAQELRDWLGIGSGPIADLFTILELDLGVRVYQRRLSSKSKVAGLFTFDPEIGACILLNANHRLARREHSAAHELGHFFGTRRAPEVLEDDEKFLSREERYANAFARAFLSPKASFEASFRQLTAGAERLTRRHVILLAHQYHISREACVRRLEELGLVKKGTWDWFVRNGGITDSDATSVLGAVASRPDPAKAEAELPLSHRMSLMAYEVWNRDLMSEGQLAQLLRMSRIELREVLDRMALGERNTDDLLKFNR